MTLRCHRSLVISLFSIPLSLLSLDRRSCLCMPEALTRNVATLSLSALLGIKGVALLTACCVRWGAQPWVLSREVQKQYASGLFEAHVF